jgi:nitrate reductase gamma subunit
MTSHALFGVWPYAALALFAAGFGVRYLLVRKRIGQVRSELPELRSWLAAGIVGRLGLALLVLGHLAGLLFPQAILSWNASPARLYLLEGVAFLIGCAVLFGWAKVMWPQMGRVHVSPAGASRRATLMGAAAELADTLFLSLLFLGLASGLLMAAVHRWGSSWGVVTLTPYAVSLTQGKPATALVGQMPFLVQLHVFTAFATLALVPFTRVALLPMVLFDGALTALARPVVAAVKAAEGWARRHNPASRIWPEED